MGPVDVLLLKILSEYDQPVKIEQAELARVCGTTVRTITRASRRLRAAGHIEFGRRSIRECFEYKVLKR